MNLVITIAAVSGPILSFVGLLLVVRNLRIAERTQKFNMLTVLHHELIAPEMQRAIRSTFAKTAAELLNPTTAEDLESIELVLRTFDLLAHRLKCGALPREETLQTEWITVVSLWPRLQPFIDRMERERGVPYKRFFRWLHDEAEKYKAKHFPQVVINYITWQFPVGA
jgi:hypothetical protein